MGVRSFLDLMRHHGHKIACVMYGKMEGPEGSTPARVRAEGAENVALECEDCHEVLLDFNRDESEMIETTKEVLRGPMYDVFKDGFEQGMIEQQKRTFPGYNRDKKEVLEYWKVYWACYWKAEK